MQINWKTGLFMIGLAGVAALAMVGCMGGLADTELGDADVTALAIAAGCAVVGGGMAMIGGKW
jgi:hypothetical protein